MSIKIEREEVFKKGVWKTEFYIIRCDYGSGLSTSLKIFAKEIFNLKKELEKIKLEHE